VIFSRSIDDPGSGCAGLEQGGHPCHSKRWRPSATENPRIGKARKAGRLYSTGHLLEHAIRNLLLRETQAVGGGVEFHPAIGHAVFRIDLGNEVFQLRLGDDYLPASMASRRRTASLTKSR